VEAHPEADICDDPSCCEAHQTEDELIEKWGNNYGEYWAKVIAAVQDTDGEYLTYEGEPIQAVFHSSSLGQTEDSSAIWGALPYLVSVSSPETADDVPNFVTEVEVSVTDFASSLRAEGIDADLSGTPDLWLTDLTLDDSGRVHGRHWWYDDNGFQTAGNIFTSFDSLQA
jgi:stage II sporulation protein D